MIIIKKRLLFFVLFSILIVASYSIFIISPTLAQNNKDDNSLFTSLSRNLNSTIDGIQNNALSGNNNNNTQ